MDYQMPSPSRRSAAPPAVVWTGALGLSLSGAMIVIGVMMGGPYLFSFGAAGSLGVVITVAALGLMLSRRATGDAKLAERMAELSRAMEQLAEQGALSDDARRVLNRRRDRELLRRAIEEDINAEDWDAAMVLVKELAERFGYRSDAEEFRARIEQARFETVQRKVSGELAHLDALIRARRWDQAMTEAARIVRLYPDSPRVEGLRHQVEHARRLYKTDLERQFLRAAEENRIDEAMEILRELDAYLTEAEAEPYREVAKGVISKARENLGAQFKLAVHDRRWGRASELGEQIIAQFPNSRMAEEVRAVLDDIRTRAREVAV
jgi:tetratricopeptide (TPR) repeat protein